MGQGVEQSLSITLNIQELHGPKIWVKASNEEHRKILQRLRDDRAPVPEWRPRSWPRISSPIPACWI